MTTIDAAAAIRVRKPGRIAALGTAGALALLLAGCAGANGPSLDGTIPQATLAPTGPATTQPTASTRVAIAPVIGAPEDVATQVTAQLSNDLKGKGVAVTAANETPDYTIRGYMVAARERAGTKVSYIWDVTDPKGERVNRITGEEVVTGAATGDPWASVSPAVVAQIASKTATSLGAWLPSQRPSSAPAAPAPVSGIPVAAAQPTTPAPRQIASGSTTQTTTGSIPRGSLTVVAPRVTGAPGDGSVSLARALTKELTSNGVSLVNAPTTASYNVSGKVSAGPANAGKQPIQIDWVVMDPSGKNLGTVSQKNEIPAGSLDGAWGQTADAAAGAAAQGILRLLKQTPATN